MAEFLSTLADFYVRQWPVMVLSFPVMLLPFALLERRFFVARAPALRDYLFNLAINISSLALAAPFGLLAAEGAAALRGLGLWPTLAISFADVGIGVPGVDEGLRVAAMIVLPLLIHDCWFYWSHRLEHALPWLWAFHRLHHSDPNMNASTFCRDHVGQNIWRGFFSMFTLGLVFDLELKDAAQAALLSNLFLGLWSQFYHSALLIQLPWLDRVLVTPQVHRIHHSALPEHRDKNFADVFPVFDIVFGTYAPPMRHQFPATGLGDGSEPPRQWWRAQWEPFSRLFVSRATS